MSSSGLIVAIRDGKMFERDVQKVGNIVTIEKVGEE